MPDMVALRDFEHQAAPGITTHLRAGELFTAAEHQVEFYTKTARAELIDAPKPAKGVKK